LVNFASVGLSGVVYVWGFMVGGLSPVGFGGYARVGGEGWNRVLPKTKHKKRGGAKGKSRSISFSSPPRGKNHSTTNKQKKTGEKGKNLDLRGGEGKVKGGYVKKYGKNPTKKARGGNA